MEIYKVALFGHREVYKTQRLEEKLFKVLKQLIQTKSYLSIYIGRNGEFDTLAASVIKHAQRTVGKENNEMILVLPYSNKDENYFEKYYDSVIIPECMKKVYPKAAIAKRNKWMVEQCDLLICYVEHPGGGAYTALNYAKRLGKDIINLTDDE